MMLFITNPLQARPVRYWITYLEGTVKSAMISLRQMLFSVNLMILRRKLSLRAKRDSKRKSKTVNLSSQEEQRPQEHLLDTEPFLQDDHLSIEGLLDQEERSESS